MKRIQRLIATFVLTLALALSAAAGNMPTPGIQQPSPSTEATGNMPTPGVEATDPASGIDPVTAFTLNLLQSLLALF
ncbi:MAG TPA: hypothetical protein VGC87_05605 [Pyrinomonadaceae bacterium]|jgi:hypothetical protein